MKLSEVNTEIFSDYPNTARREFEAWKKRMLEHDQDVEIISISQGHGENNADEYTPRLSISVIYTQKGR